LRSLTGPASRRLRPTKSARTAAPAADIEQQEGKQKQVQKKSLQSVRLRGAQNRSRKRRKAQSAARRRAYQSRRVGKLGKGKVMSERKEAIHLDIFRSKVRKKELIK
jgi:hypothetical protein